jgi:hypothetical protein
MTAYLLIFILAVGIPFLLYCLWNFARDLRPQRSAALVSSRVTTSTNAARTIPPNRVRNLSRIVSLRDESRAAS